MFWGIVWWKYCNNTAAFYAKKIVMKIIENINCTRYNVLFDISPKSICTLVYKTILILLMFKETNAVHLLRVSILIMDFQCSSNTDSVVLQYCCILLGISILKWPHSAAFVCCTYCSSAKKHLFAKKRERGQSRQLQVFFFGRETWYCRKNVGKKSYSSRENSLTYCNIVYCCTVCFGYLVS